MKRLFYLFSLGILFYAFFSCSKNNNCNDLLVCGVLNPESEIEWLSDLIYSFEMDMGLQRQKITYYQYNLQDVF